MISNSQIFTSSVYGNSSSDTRSNLIARATATIESVYSQQGLTKMNNRQPKVPSNQGKLRG